MLRRIRLSNAPSFIGDVINDKNNDVTGVEIQGSLSGDSNEKRPEIRANVSIFAAISSSIKKAVTDLDIFTCTQPRVIILPEFSHRSVGDMVNLICRGEHTAEKHADLVELLELLQVIGVNLDNINIQEKLVKIETVQPPPPAFSTLSVSTSRTATSSGMAAQIQSLGTNVSMGGNRFTLSVSQNQTNYGSATAPIVIDLDDSTPSQFTERPPLPPTTVIPTSYSAKRSVIEKIMSRATSSSLPPVSAQAPSSAKHLAQLLLPKLQNRLRTVTADTTATTHVSSHSTVNLPSYVTPTDGADGGELFFGEESGLPDPLDLSEFDTSSQRPLDDLQRIVFNDLPSPTKQHGASVSGELMRMLTSKDTEPPADNHGMAGRSAFANSHPRTGAKMAVSTSKFNAHIKKSLDIGDGDRRWHDKPTVSVSSISADMEYPPVVPRGRPPMKRASGGGRKGSIECWHCGKDFPSQSALTHHTHKMHKGRDRSPGGDPADDDDATEPTRHTHETHKGRDRSSDSDTADEDSDVSSPPTPRGDQQRFKCDLCEADFSAERSLDRHRKSCNGSRWIAMLE